MSNRPLLTAEIIEALRASPPKSAKVTMDGDAKAPGFGVRLTPNGVATFVLRYRLNGQERKMALGPFPAMSASQARNKAKAVLQEILAGRDPLAEKEAARTAPTVGEMLDRFELEHLPKCRPSTATDYRRIISKHIRPKLGARKLADLDYAAIDTWHAAIVAAGTPYRANAALRVLSCACNLAVHWQWLDRNPCQRVKKAPEQPRERYLTADELQRLSTALDALADDARMAQTVRLVTFLLLTGARCGETMQARWADFDLEAGVWSKPSAHTKQKRTHRVPLAPAAVALLQHMKAHPAPLAGGPKYGKRLERAEAHAAEITASPYVFPSRHDPARPMTEPKNGWKAICKAAGITSLRIHDLRHSFASMLASGGASLALVGQLLGHTQAQTTMRYAHLFDDAQREAAELVARRIEAARGE